MEITINKSELSSSLTLIQNIVEKRNTMPILSNVLLTAAEGTLRASATDLEITAFVETAAEVHAAGSTTVNAKVFYEVIREVPEEKIKIKLTEGERVEITSGTSKVKIIGVSAEEYPSLPGLSLNAANRIPAAQLHEMISKTLYAVSADETRFNLSGVNFEILEEEGQKSLLMVATDGHRLAKILRPIEGLAFSQSVLVPRKGLGEIKKLLEGLEGEVGVDINEGFMVIEAEVNNGRKGKISMRLIDGEFPDYKQVLPKDEGVDAIVNSEELIQALRRVSLVVSDKAKGVKFDFAPGNLKISSSSPELGEAKEELAIKYEGQPLSVGFNAKYVMDVGASLGESKSLRIELHGELGPGKFSAENDPSYIAIVMPMRLM